MRRHENGAAVMLGAARGLSLAAAPAFAVMSLLAVVSGGDPGMHGAGPFDGMALMYLLMSVFHSAPWLTRVATRYRTSEVDARKTGSDAKASLVETSK